MTNRLFRMRLPLPLVLPIAVCVLAQAPMIVRGEGQVLDLTLTHAGYGRTYHLYVPSGYTPANSAPLVLNLHGGETPQTINGISQMDWTGMNVVAEREGFLTVYPDSLPGGWWGTPPNDPYDDAGFFDAMIAALSSQYTVDSSRIYVTGLSRGGLMTYILGAARPYTYAAIAPVAGDRPKASAGSTEYLPLDLPATPGRPFPLLHIHGTDDQRIPYDGGTSLGWEWPRVEEVVGKYAENNGADSVPGIVDLPNINTDDDSTVQLWTYGNADMYLDTEGNAHEAEVLLYRIENGGHNWPDTDVVRHPPVNRDINASEVVWDFFSRHAVAKLPLPGDYNGDAAVDTTDYGTWRDTFGSTIGFYAGADGNGDGIVDAADYTVWRDNLGLMAATSAGTGFNSENVYGRNEVGVPEPPTVMLLALALITGAARRRPAGSDFLKSRTVAITVAALLSCILFAGHQAALGDVYRWDNGELVPGTEGIAVQPSMDLSYWNTESHNLRFADFAGADLHQARFDASWLDAAQLHNADVSSASLSSALLSNANLAGANLTNADLSFATLIDANLAGAIIAGANFTGTAGYALYEEPSRGFTKELLYSTRSYQEKNLRGIHFEYNDLVGWDFSGQNLQNAVFGTGCGLGGCDIANTTDADFSAADLRGAMVFTDSWFFSLPDHAVTRNTLWSEGEIRGLDLLAGDTLAVRDDDGHLREYYDFEAGQWQVAQVDPLPITVEDRMSVAASGRLELLLEADAWDSTIQFEPGIPVSLGGTLELLFGPEVDVSAQVGRSFQLFDWTGVTPIGEFHIVSPYIWDASRLYSAGEITFVGVPEASSLTLLALGLSTLLLRRRR